MKIVVSVQSGEDIVVAGTDGLLDNMYALYNSVDRYSESLFSRAVHLVG